MKTVKKYVFYFSLFMTTFLLFTTLIEKMTGEPFELWVRVFYGFLWSFVCLKISGLIFDKKE